MAVQRDRARVLDGARTVLDEGDPDCVFVAARQDGVVRAFLQFVPWGTDGMSLDLMRRDATADPASTS